MGRGRSGIPEPEQKGGQGAEYQDQPVSGEGMLHREPADRGMRMGMGMRMKMKMGGHGNLPSLGPPSAPKMGRWTDRRPEKMGSRDGNWPEKPGEQGSRQDENPVKHHGMPRIMAAEQMGHHGSLLSGSHVLLTKWGVRDGLP